MKIFVQLDKRWGEAKAGDVIQFDEVKGRFIIRRGLGHEVPPPAQSPRSQPQPTALPKPPAEKPPEKPEEKEEEEPRAAEVADAAGPMVAETADNPPVISAAGKSDKPGKGKKKNPPAATKPAEGGVPQE